MIAVIRDKLLRMEAEGHPLPSPSTVKDIIEESSQQRQQPLDLDAGGMDAMSDSLNNFLSWQLLADYLSPDADPAPGPISNHIPTPIPDTHHAHQHLLAAPISSILFNKTLEASNAFSANATFVEATISTTVTTATTTTTMMMMMSSTSDALSGALVDNSTALFSNGTDSCSPDNNFMVALPWIRMVFGLLMAGENALSLLALWYVRHMVRAIHRFIASLAVAELLMGVWCIYRYSAEILMTSDSLTPECRLRFVGSTYLNFAAILSVCALCLDRSIALYFPFRYGELVTKKRLRLALGLIWTLPLLFVLTAYVESSQDGVAYGDGGSDCTFVHIASQRTYVVLTVVRCVFIAVIIVCELLIFRSARCQIGKICPTVFSSRNHNRFLRMNAKAAFTTLAVVVPFLLLYFPVLFVQGRLAVRPDLADDCQGQLLSFVWLIASAHGLFTPLIFCWRFSEVRQNLVRLLCCVCRTSPNRGVPSVFQLRTTNDSGSA